MKPLMTVCTFGSTLVMMMSVLCVCFSIVIVTFILALYLFSPSSCKYKTQAHKHKRVLNVKSDQNMTHYPTAEMNSQSCDNLQFRTFTLKVKCSNCVMVSSPSVIFSLFGLAVLLKKQQKNGL